jgi:hypothetical protein
VGRTDPLAMLSCSLSVPPTVGLKYGIKTGGHERLKSETQRVVSIQTLLCASIFMTAVYFSFLLKNSGSLLYIFI